MIKTLIGVNCLQNIDSKVYSSHCQFWFRTKQHYPEDQFFFYTPNRMSIDRMRNEAAKIAMEAECDYLMFIDDDVIVHPDTFKSLYECNLDIVMAHTYIRGYPYPPMAFKFNDNGELPYFKNYKDFIDSSGIYACDAVGFSCVLIKTWLFKTIPPPYFITGSANTEDIYFCLKAKDVIGESVTIGVDTKVPTAHRVDNYYITEENVERLRRLNEAEDPSILVNQNTAWRTFEEVEENIAICFG